MKKGLSLFLLSFVIISMCTQLSFAQENLKEEVVVDQVESEKIYYGDKEERIRVQAPDYYTEEYQQFIKDNIEHSEEQVYNRIVPMSVDSRRLSVPLVKQETTYYCGPASLKMVLSYKGKSYSQSTLASYAGTNSSEGTYVYRMKDTLNRILGNRYVYVNVNDQSFGNGLVYSIDKDYPVICHVRTGALENYSGADTGHYVVSTGYIAGFSGNNWVSDVYYNDPHYNDRYYGSHRDTFQNMSTAIDNNAGFFIRSK